MSDNIEQHDRRAMAGAIMEQLTRDLGAGWSDALTPAERDLVRSVSEDAATVLLLGLSGDRARAARERAHVEAQLRNLSSAEAARVTRVFWSSVAAVVKTALGIVLAAAV